MNKKLSLHFFDASSEIVAKALLGKVLRRRYQGLWLSALIIETEAYYLWDKASHASLGFTEKRKALFMPPGTIYMYYSRAGDSMNISCDGEGNAVLIKSAVPYLLEKNVKAMIAKMRKLNPLGARKRPLRQLCSGQTLLCRSLGLKVPEWDQKQFNHDLQIIDVGYRPKKILISTRLGIRSGRDEHLPLRFIDANFVAFCTKPIKNATIKKFKS
jgi:DNA-3-methyladenine glycosylase